MDLFSGSKKQQLPMVDGDVTYYPKCFNSDNAKSLLDNLLKTIHWQQDEIRLFGKTHKQPRLTALYANNTKPYKYSNIIMHPHPFTSELLAIKFKIDHIAQTEFTSCLLNLYRDGNDSNGWHADDEKELGNNPVIASLSLGADRMFHFKHKKDKQIKHKLILQHGSLLLMKGATQHNWLHQLPKTKKKIGKRINLTFRIIA